MCYVQVTGRGSRDVTVSHEVCQACDSGAWRSFAGLTFNWSQLSFLFDKRSLSEVNVKLYVKYFFDHNIS